MIPRTAALALGVVFFSSFFIPALPAHAQSAPLPYGTTLSIGLSPQYPRAGDTVRLTVQGSGLDLSASAIVWRAGGKVIAQGMGATSADTAAGALGTETPIEADIAAPDGGIYSVQAALAPTEVDLLLSSDSYTPPFYRGRALPSAGTNLIVQALTRFKRADGTFIADADITYTWKRNGEVLGTLSGRGKSSAVIPVALLFTRDTVTVDAVSSDGARAGGASVSIPSRDPLLDLYVDHPLYGVLYNNALQGPAPVPETEMAFVAVPYFAQAGGANDPGLSYVWKVNDTSVEPNAATPNELTINADNSNGQAQIALEVTRATNFYMYTTGGWRIVFPNGAGIPDRFGAGIQKQ